MAPPPRTSERLALRALAAADGLLDRLYGSRWNPLYQSGVIAAGLLLVLLVTGLWLLVFYRVGAPYESVARITADPWMGRWLRGVHRYASDVAVVAIAVHAFRMFAQGRSWGPRALAWTSGVVLLGLLWVCGLTGYVMVWDSFGHELAREGARLLDSLPILSEPISRAFAGEDALLGPFFFLNMFAHIAIPLGMALVFWLHVSRVARPVMLPPRRLTIVLVVLLVVASFAWPLVMQPEANAFALPATLEVDLFYAFWLPLVRGLPAGVALAAIVIAGLALMAVPLFVRRRGAAVPPPSVVDESVCTGCTQCSLDCPYEAITMIQRPPGGRSIEVARVDPALCVSCGICAGSCAPMAVGPPGRTGREQLAALRARVAEGALRPGVIVALCCERGARAWGDRLVAEGADLYPVDCTGSAHTSVVELFVRSGAGGVLVLSCPPRDCWNREGPRWTGERLFHDREAELQARVDRRRVRMVDVAAGDAAKAVAALRAFALQVAALDAVVPEGAVEVGVECEPVVASEDA